uniref:NAD-binding protein n=1 Tax=Anaerofustis sp. TaxID=1872517 RepID=UPI0025BD859C
RNDEVFIPSGDFKLKSLDKIYILAKPINAMKMFRSFEINVETGRTAILVGGGRIAVYLAKQLIASNISVKIIEIDPIKCEELSEILPNATILCGDGLDKELLLEEGLTNVDSFASLTGLDEENIILSLYAASVSDAKIITKINKLSFDNIISKMEIGSIIEPKYITSEYIIQYVRAIQNSFGSNVESLYKIVGGKAEALEFSVKENSVVTGKSLQSLELKDNSLIASINRNGNIIVPSGKDTIEVGDSVIIITTHKKLGDLTDILK